MCNLDRLRLARDEIANYFGTTLDPASRFDVDKDYAAPGKPGYVIREDAGVRVLSTMKRGFPTTKPRKGPTR